MSKHSGSLSIGKLWIEVCLISARGMPRASLWKLQWYAVGWIDPSNKYCTKIDMSGSSNPMWKTKFTTVIDTSETDVQDLTLHLEVYSREPFFLGEKLQGTATILLKEFLNKYSKNSEESKQGHEEVGSFQLRKKNSEKPQGFIDVSVRISKEQEAASSFPVLGNEEGFTLNYGSNAINSVTNAGPMQAYPAGQLELPYCQPAQYPPNPSTHPGQFPTNYSNPSVSGPSYPPPNRPSYPAPPPPPPPLPSSNAGYMPNFFPRMDSQTPYINLPSSAAGAAAGRGVGLAVGVGLGAGALAAGAVKFGENLMSGFQLPARNQNANLTFALDPFKFNTNNRV